MELYTTYVLTIAVTVEVAVMVGEARVVVVEVVTVVVARGILLEMQEQPADKMAESMSATQDEKGRKLVNFAAATADGSASLLIFAFGVT